MDNLFDKNEKQTVKCSCPECGALIYDVLAPCPKCGLPSDDLRNHYEEQEKRKKEEKKKASDEFHKELYEVIEKGGPQLNGKYDVDPAAERIINAIASSILIIGWIIGGIIAIFGIALAIEELDYGEQILVWAGVGLVLAGAGIVLVAYTSWARIKLLVNMSNTLYNINDALRGNK